MNKSRPRGFAGDALVHGRPLAWKNDLEHRVWISGLDRSVIFSISRHSVRLGLVDRINRHPAIERHIVVPDYKHPHKADIGSRRSGRHPRDEDDDQCHADAERPSQKAPEDLVHRVCQKKCSLVYRVLGEE